MDAAVRRAKSMVSHFPLVLLAVAVTPSPASITAGAGSTAAVDWLEIAKIIPGVVALVLAGYTLWLTHLRSFHPILKPGDVIWRMEQLPVPVEAPTGSVNPSRLLTLIMTIQFTNDGARSGFVEDLALELTSSGIGRQIFSPLFYVSIDSLQEGLAAGKTSEELGQSPYYPFALLGKGEEVRTIIFGPAAPAALENPPPGEYRIKVLGRTSASPTFQCYSQATYRLEQKHIDALQRKMVVTIINQEADVARQRLMTLNR